MRRSVSFIGLFLLFSAICWESAAQSLPVKDEARPATAYRIQPGDRLSIKFFNNPDLNELNVAVRPDGFINLQIINEVAAQGLTVTELKRQLEKAYDEILLEPIISVAIIEFTAPHVFIAGQVTRPGRYGLREAKTLRQAIFLAGGFTRDANRKMVIHARPKGTDDWAIRSADVLKILSSKESGNDLVLQEGDYVFVPDSKISQFNRAVESFRGLLPRFF